jgi:N6-adenosine-specific RNA methylase IME4
MISETSQPATPMHDIVIPPGGFRCILADPPWNYESKKPTERMRPCVAAGKNPASVNHYYETMKLNEIKAMPVESFSSMDSVLFLWATTPLLPEAFDVMQAWGWKYKTTITWHKTNNDCMGYWFRVCTEHLIVGVRGDVKPFRSMRRTLLETPRRKHSQKPNESYAMIEEVCEGPRIELFARQKREGWEAWGNQVDSEPMLF